MRITCPSCGTGYDVAENAIGPQGRKVRCRACGASWVEPARGGSPSPAAPSPLPPPIAPPPPPVKTPSAGWVAPRDEPVAPAMPPPAEVAPAPSVSRRRHLRAPAFALLLVVVALALGIAIASLVFGPRQLASDLGLVDTRVPLGIAITKEPDWRELAGGSELFAVSGRIWNPTAQAQSIPDIRAEIKDRRGRTLRTWTIARPAQRLAPGAHVDFDGAAMDVPRDSATIALSFVGERR